jgi:HK97 family phage portal protein
MSLFSWVGRTFGLTGDGARRFWAMFSGSGSGSGGEIVTPERAMAVMAFWRGVRLKASTIGTLPKAIYKNGADGGQGVKDRTTPYDVVARSSPNDYQTPTEFWEGIVAAQVALGNGYALKKFVGDRLVALWPLDPQRTYPWRNSQGVLRYRGHDWGLNYYPDLAPEEVFHLKGFSFGGDLGLSAIQYGAGALGLSMAANRVASDNFRSGLSASGFLETAQTFGEEDRTRLEEIMATYQKSETPGKMMVLEGGMKFNKLSLTAVDAQLLQTMGFNIEEVARLLDLPPILLGHAGDGQTMWGTGVEAIIQAWYSLGLRADITRVEDAFEKRVIAPKDQDKFYLKIIVDGLLRGDSQTRALISATLAQNGLRNRDELRELDDYGAIPDGSGKKFTAQVNLTPLAKLGEPGTASTDRLLPGQQPGQPPPKIDPNKPPAEPPVKNLLAMLLEGATLEEMLEESRKQRSRLN